MQGVQWLAALCLTSLTSSLSTSTSYTQAGYLYDFPFLAGTDIVTVDDNRVAPLFQHVFPPATAPTLSFLGLPWKVSCTGDALPG